MKNPLSKIFQIAAVFIGTIVGAGLASGKEISQFFTSYGYKSFIGIFICGLMYILVCSMFIKISTKYNLKSYNELIKLVSPGFLGEVIEIFMSFFLISGAAIILAGSGALINQFFGISKWVGILLMVFLTIIVLLRDTQGLVEVNSIIVPSLIIVISTIFLLYLISSMDIISIKTLKAVPYYNKNWLFSTILYAGFNMLSCSGVLVPISNEFKNNRTIIYGIILGALFLTLICGAINLMLMLNVPYIYNFEIPLLYISNRFGKGIQIMLLCIIWCEMFSTEISDIYSVGKMLESLSHSKNMQLKNKYNLSFLDRFILNLTYKKSVFLILLLSIPISQIGFSNLIKVLYPSFGVISVIFIIQCTIFYIKNIEIYSKYKNFKHMK